MDRRRWYGGHHQDGPDHRQQPEYAKTPKRRRTNTSYREPPDNDAVPNQPYPSDTVTFSRENLQSAEWALNCARMALAEPHAPSSHPYPSVTISFRREGLRSIETALNNVRMALTNPQAPIQTRRDGGLGPELDNSVKIPSETSNSSRSSYEPGHSISDHITHGDLSSSHPDPSCPAWGNPKPASAGNSAASDTVSMQGSHLEPQARSNVVASHEESRALLGIAATYHVTIEGKSVPLVPVPYNPQGYTPKISTCDNKGFNGRATARLSQFPGFTFPCYGSKGLQEMAPFFDALSNQRPVNERKMHRVLYNIFPLIFREMLSQRKLYTKITSYATKRAFFFHIHQIHYSVLVQNHNALLNPTSRAKPNTRADNWAGLEVDVLVKVVEAVILAREAFLQNLAAKRNAAATSRARTHSLDQQGTDLGCFSKKMETDYYIKAEKGADPQVKQEPGLTISDEDDFGFKPESNDWDNVRLGNVPKLDGGNDDECWLKYLDSEDEESVLRPPPTGREHRKARKAARIRAAEMRTRNAVNHWIRFVRLELGRSQNAVISTTASAPETQDI